MMEKESAKQARMPMMPASVMADKSKGNRSKTPPLPTNMADHVPMMAESATAAPKGKAMSGMSGWPSASMSDKGRMPDMAPSVMSKKGRGC